MKTNERTNIYISDEARALLSALGAASTGKPSMAAGLAELIARVTDGIVAYPMKPGDENTQYKAYWTNPGQENDPETENQFTEFAYPDRPSAIAAAVLLRFEEARAAALAADREAAEVIRTAVRELKRKAEQQAKKEGTK